MDISSLMAISPLDGRYQDKVTSLREIFSEYGLIKHRIIVEIRWLELLLNLPEIGKLSSSAKKQLDDMIESFSPIDAMQIKKIEARINHEEHQEIKLPMGFHRIHQKRQYTPDGWESVRD